MSLGTLATMLFAEDASANSVETLPNADPMDVGDKEAVQPPPVVGVAVMEEIREPVERSSQDDRIIHAQQYLVSPVRPEGAGNVHMITVVLRASGDKTRDVLRLRRIHGTIMSFPAMTGLPSTCSNAAAATWWSSPTLPPDLPTGAS